MVQLAETLLEGPPSFSSQQSKMSATGDPSSSVYILLTKMLQLNQFMCHETKINKGQGEELETCNTSQGPFWPHFRDFNFSTMFTKIALLFLCVLPMPHTSGDEAADFAYTGFHGSNVSLNGIASITPDGLLMLTNTSAQQIGRAFYPALLQFKNTTNGNAISFSTTFIFAMVPDNPVLAGHGIAFVISPSKELHGALPSQYLGLFNASGYGNSSSPVVAVELDTIYSSEFGDINNNHVGIDINSLRSNESSPAAYYTSNGLKNISLINGKPIQIWIEYNGEEMQLRVTLAPVSVPKPDIPLLTATVNLSEFISDSSYVGFSSSTGSAPTAHYLLGWSFKTNGQAQPLDLLRLPTLPQKGSKVKSKALTIGLPAIVTVFVLLFILSIILAVRRKIKYAEVLEDWEHEYGPHRFSFRDLFVATNGFKEKQLLGFGGFGRVYRGLLKASQTEVAVKRISHDSRQGMREFVAEIVSLGQLRHRNLVQLLGYCRRKGELLLVYDFMPNGSLDKFLFDHPKSMLDWGQRFLIVKGVASGLLYLHEEWEQVVVHRDIKASNILLDSALNGKLGDFGLARLCDHGSNPETTNVVGTMGYIAPELTRTGKASTSTDVYAFGVFLLEVACGRRPIDSRALPEKMILLDVVFDCWKRGAILEAADPKLGSEYVIEEVELVLKLGLLCSNQIELSRPSMRQVVQFLEGESPLPEMSLDGFSDSVLARGGEALDDLRSCPSAAGSLFEGR